MKNKKFIEQAFEQSYQKVCDIEQRIKALHYAIKPLRDKWTNYRDTPDASKQFGNLHGELYELLNEAYRQVFMFGVVSCDRKLMARAKQLAFDHYLTENNGIAEYLGFKNEYPSDIEKQFRTELEFLKKS